MIGDFIELVKEERDTRICLAVSCVIAVVLLLPDIARSLDFSIGFVGAIIKIPATGAHYIGTFFHEIGHTVAYWIFGYAAFPSFDFAHGGGMTYSFNRLMPAMFIVDVFLLGLLYWLWEVKPLRIAIPALVGLHLALGLTGAHDLLTLFMGHGLEIGIAAFFLYRAWTNYVVGGNTERYLNGILGFFMIFSNMHMDLGLMMSDIHRIVYEQQKGGHGFGDFSRIADMMSMPLEGVAAFSLLLCVVALLVPLPLYVHAKARYMAEEEEAPRDRARRLRRGE